MKKFVVVFTSGAREIILSDDIFFALAENYKGDQFKDILEIKEVKE